MFGSTIRYSGVVKLATSGAAVIVKVAGMAVGDETKMTLIRCRDGGVLGKTPKVSCEAGSFQIQGDLNDQSSWAWSWAAR